MNPPSQLPDIAVEVQSVHKFYKKVHAVDDVSLQIRRGEYVALLGPNGAGKTTLVSMIEGIHSPERGTVSVFGKNWRDHEKELRPLLGIALQETRFIDRATARETLHLFASFYGHDGDRCEEILQSIRLQEKGDAYTMNLSNGQRQKLALGVALLHRPPLLILDEPTTGLDPLSRRELWEILMELKSRGTTLILTSHYMEEAEFLCDRIFILDHGKIIAKGTLTELLDAQGMSEWISFSAVEPVDEAMLSEIPGLVSIQWQSPSRSACLQVRRIVEALPVLLRIVQDRTIRLEELECRKMNLDDLFTSMTGRLLHD